MKHGSRALTLPTLHEFANLKHDEYAHTQIDFSKIQHQTWPERPWKLNHVVLAGGEFINATSSYGGNFGAELVKQAAEMNRSIEVSRFESLSTDPAFKRSAWLIDRSDDPRHRLGLI